MKIISFAWTTPALLAGRKTCTRRDWDERYAQSFKASEMVQAYDKSPRVGGKKVAVIKLVGTPILTDMMPADDYDAEGLKWMEEQEIMVPVTDVKSKRKLPMHPRRFWEAWLATRFPMWLVRFELVNISTTNV